MLRFKNNPDKVVAASYLQQLKDFYVEKTLDEANPEILRLLEEKRGYLSLQEYQTTLNAVITDVQAPDLSFELLPNSQITNHGALGLAVLCGLNLKQAFSIVLKFYRIRSQLFTMYLKEKMKIQLV